MPLEVALMQIVSRPPSCCYVLGLLDWFEEAERFILVVERPYPCMDLFDFIEELGGRVDECLARIIMIQVMGLDLCVAVGKSVALETLRLCVHFPQGSHTQISLVTTNSHFT